MPAVLNEQTQYTDSAGKPIVSGLLYIGVNGSDPVANPKSIFSDRDLTSALSNPQTLDANGRSTNKIWVDGTYSIQVNDSSAVQQFQDLDAGEESTGISSVIVSSISGTNIITGTTDLALSAYTANQKFTFTSVNVNTAAAFLSVDSVGSKEIVKNNDQSLNPGEIESSQVVEVAYNAINDNFEWMNQNNKVVDFSEGTFVSAATSTDIWSEEGNTIHIGGATTIANFGTAPNIGAKRTLIFDSTPRVTYGASLIVLPGGVDFTAEAGDIFEVYADSLTKHRVQITKVDGLAVALTTPFANALFHAQDHKSSGTSAGTFTSGAWQTRTINSTRTNEIGASLSSNQFTLLAGDYYIQATAPANVCGNHKMKLQDITNTSTKLNGTSNDTSNGGNIALLSGRFTAASTVIYELQHRCTITKATDGFGTATGVGETEVYADVSIWKLD